MLKPKTILTMGASLAFLSVALGAFGAHALKDFLIANNRLETYQTAVQYQMYHSLALVLTGILAQIFPQISFSKVAIFFLAGIVIFSGSLYILCASGQKWWGTVTPFGGLSFLLGWFLLAFGFAKKGQ